MFSFDPNPTTAKKAWSSFSCLFMRYILYATCSLHVFDSLWWKAVKTRSFYCRSWAWRSAGCRAPSRSPSSSRTFNSCTTETSFPLSTSTLWRSSLAAMQVHFTALSILFKANTTSRFPHDLYIVCKFSFHEVFFWALIRIRFFLGPLGSGSIIICTNWCCWTDCINACKIYFFKFFPDLIWIWRM